MLFDNFLIRSLLLAGLLTAPLCQAAQLGAIKGLEEGITARCQWGKSMAGLAQEKLLAGVSRKDFMVSLDSLHYSRAWMPRMTQAIADSIYRTGSASSSAVVQEQYVNDCQQYYLAR